MEENLALSFFKTIKQELKVAHLSHFSLFKKYLTLNQKNIYCRLVYLTYMKDYYKILGVEKKASKEEIKKAFYKLAHQHHPDKNKGDDKKFKEINEAYQVLSDDKKRAHFDQFGSNPGPGSNGGGGFNYGQSGFEGFDFSGFGGGGTQGFQFDFGDMGDFFDMFSGGGQRSGNRRRKGEDLQILVEVTMAESFTGVSKKVVYNRHTKCETCHGDGAKPGTKKVECKKCSGKGVVNTTKKTIFGNFASQSICADCEGKGKIPETKCSDCRGEGIKIKKEEISIPIPEGVEDGEQLMLRGYGETISDGEAGDLYIVVKVLSEKKFIRRGLNLYTKVDLKLTDIILGYKLTIKDVQNNDLEINIPLHQNPKEQIIISKKGMKRQGRVGDLVIDINLEIPKHLSKKAKDLLEDLKSEGL